MVPPDIEKGYLDTTDDAYLEGPYLGGEYEDIFGFQVQMVINDQKVTGQQVQMVINDQVNLGQQVEMVVNSEKITGQQVEMVVNSEKITGQQVQMVINEQSDIGQQVEMVINDQSNIGQQVYATLQGELKITGQQVEMVTDNQTALGMSVKNDALRHALCDVYLVHEYLEGPYLTECMTAFMGMQVNMTYNDQIEAYGQQALMVVNQESVIGQQVEMVVNTQSMLGMQAQMIINEQVNLGQQVEMIINTQNDLGMQIQMVVNTQYDLGMQIEQVRVARDGMQATMVIYNTTQLRLMCDFPSRGTEALLGLNWVASSQYTGEYYPYNVNTDIVEQVYRSAAGTAAFTTLVCDTGIPQGVPIDTIAILGHNLTKSAQVQVQGSNDNFATPPNIIFNMTVELDNMYYISPTFPTSAGQNRYWKFIFQDFTNPDTYIEVGTIVFGTSEIFSILECFENPVVTGFRHFKDELRTEGFANVSNDRALKKYLQLNFSTLNYFKGNYRILHDAMTFARTSLKCLVIPTPQYPSRFAVFAKLVAMPEITHNDINQATGYVSLSMEWDESL